MVKQMKNKEIQVEECRTNPERNTQYNIDYTLYGKRRQQKVREEKHRRQNAHQKMMGVLITAIGLATLPVNWELSFPIITTLLGLGMWFIDAEDYEDEE